METLDADLITFAAASRLPGSISLFLSALQQLTGIHHDVAPLHSLTRGRPPSVHKPQRLSRCSSCVITAGS